MLAPPDDSNLMAAPELPLVHVCVFFLDIYPMLVALFEVYEVDEKLVAKKTEVFVVGREIGRSGEVSKTSKNREILWLIGRFGTSTNVDGVLFCDLFELRSSVPNTLQCRDCIHSPNSLFLSCVFHSRYGLFYHSYLAEDRYNRNRYSDCCIPIAISTCSTS